MSLEDVVKQVIGGKSYQAVGMNYLDGIVRVFSSLGQINAKKCLQRMRNDAVGGQLSEANYRNLPYMRLLEATRKRYKSSPSCGTVLAYLVVADNVKSILASNEGNLKTSGMGDYDGVYLNLAEDIANATLDLLHMVETKYRRAVLRLTEDRYNEVFKIYESRI